MNRGKTKIRRGIVVSNKMKKTVVVKVERVYRHPLYQKVVRTHKKYKAHDELQQCQVGDFVEIMETRPLSAQKRWRVVSILREAGK
ncbi:MAG: 30S ribosomal protein S17 [Candidatus Margulisiibacteriota bacterium]